MSLLNFPVMEVTSLFKLFLMKHYKLIHEFLRIINPALDPFPNVFSIDLLSSCSPSADKIKLKCTFSKIKLQSIFVIIFTI